MLNVIARPCETCIYKGGLYWNLEALEDQVRDPKMANFFVGARTCHHTPKGANAVCRGFWNAHKDDFAAGQIAQRLDLINFVEPTGDA